MVYGITENETRVMDFIIRHFGERNSINQIGKLLKLSPRGIYKILKNLERMKVVEAENIGNAMYYHANLENEAARNLAAFVLSQKDMNVYARVYANNLKKNLGEIVESIVLFGSILDKGDKARDVDVLLIFDKSKFKEVSRIIDEMNELSPRRIHDIRMAPKDLGHNLQKGNEAMIDLIRKGVILKGAHHIVEAIEHGSRRQQA
jgi:predicted nucleotidyltransferase